MMSFAFVSRQAPTPEQVALAEAKGVRLVHVGGANAFDVTPDWVDSKGAFVGAVVFHPAAAMRLASNFEIGVFAIEAGEPTAFYTYKVWEM